MRRIVTKVEIAQLGGTNIRFVVTNMSGHDAGISQGFYVQRGNFPERPIGEFKNDLYMDRLSSHRFVSNSHKLMTHLLAYALYVLFREANEKTPEVNKMEVSTARTHLFKVGALVQATHRHIWFRVASHHTDRGGQYAGNAYRSILRRAEIRDSMSRADNCCDNSFMESVNGTVTTELESNEY